MTLTPDRPTIASFLADTVRTDIHLVALSGEQSHGSYWADNPEGAADWALAYNAAGWNLYWTVNAVTPGTQSKPTKAAIAHARYVHVDIDPPRSGPWDAQAALARLAAMNPTVILNSGNGWQGLWRLATPATDLALVEAVNRGAIAAVGGDPSCWNIDRLLRLPGTVNYPSATKQARGYTVTLASVAQADNGAAYALDALFPPTAASAPRESIEVPTYALLGPDDLVPPPGERLRALITAPDGTDRSRDVAACAFELAACGYDTATTVGILMNPANAVHAHIADQPYPERAAVRAAGMAAQAAPAAAFQSSGERPALPAGATLEPPPRDPRLRDPGREYMGAADQLMHFAGCTYVRDCGRIWTGEMMLDKGRFDIEYGGHQFMLDMQGEKKTTSAWEAFTQSRALRTPMVDGTCFRPLLGAGAVIERESQRLVNTWVPIETRRIPGDPAPFLDFLQRLLPVKTDRDILLAYMASLIQNPGRKFQWWPVVQGTEGNGKTLLVRCLMHAVGHRYTHLPNAPDLARNGLKFNGWVTGNLLCGVEEISLGHKRDFLEEFKPIVTNDRVPIEKKGVDEITGDNCINGILMTNHRDGVPITVDTRRYAVFYTAQQSREDKIRDGMVGRYFPDLYGWLEADGYAIVAHYLANYAVPAALDPASDCVEAPRTSSFHAALRASLGRVEQEILEQIEQGKPGFCGGWVSSLYLDRLLTDLKVAVPRNKRKEMMQNLGYVPHPALPDGRVNAPVNPDGGKPRLYVAIGHESLGITDVTGVARAYSDAQQEAVTGATVLAFKRSA